MLAAVNPASVCQDELPACCPDLEAQVLRNRQLSMQDVILAKERTVQYCPVPSANHEVGGLLWSACDAHLTMVRPGLWHEAGDMLQQPGGLPNQCQKDARAKN